MQKNNANPSDDKEEKTIEECLPYGMTAGVVIGSILSFVYNDAIYITYGICGGLLLGLLAGSIISNHKKN